MLRQNVTFIFLLSTYLISTGQSTNSVVDTNRLWSVKYQSCQNPFPLFDNYFCKFSDNINIDSVLYKTVLGTHDTTLSSWTVYGYIREDSLKKVFFRNTSGAEGLIYNFNVNAGDTILIKNTNINNDTTLTMVIDYIDSIFIYNKYLKQIHLHRPIYPLEEVWIETIGSLTGILESCYKNYGIIGVCYDLLCFTENDTLKYINPDNNSCYFITDIKDTYFSKTKISLYPNPVNSEILIEVMENLKGGLITLTNGTGKELFKSVITEKTLKLNTSSMHPGIYVITITKSGETYRQKLSVAH